MQILGGDLALVDEKALRSRIFVPFLARHNVEPPVREQVAYVKKRHPEVTEIFGDFKFRGQGQERTDVADLRGAVELTFLLPDRHAGRVRRQAAELLCRYLGGDLALVDRKYSNGAPGHRRRKIKFWDMNVY